jgi:hypothetical protein
MISTQSIGAYRSDRGVGQLYPLLRAAMISMIAERTTSSTGLGRAPVGGDTPEKQSVYARITGVGLAAIEASKQSSILKLVA